ncbi:hypothetical protein WUBG_11597 [Wuchereria bancrofti]|uniref:Uncharacterized protein n=1 Tax=Wuchereria bancrofti TaxID=6293 RepID=J9ASV1_WUCBA|nr:hypothetical protein WUBG_11597 [Wuchereria bancrofti]
MSKLQQPISLGDVFYLQTGCILYLSFDGQGLVEREFRRGNAQLCSCDLSQDYPCMQSRDWIELDEMTILANSSALYFAYAPLGSGFRHKYLVTKYNMKGLTARTTLVPNLSSNKMSLLDFSKLLCVENDIRQYPTYTNGQRKVALDRRHLH